MKFLLDAIPLVIFFYLAKTQDIFAGTQGLLIATAVVYVLHFLLQKGRLEKTQWLTLFATLAFCTLTLVLHDDYWLRWKSSVINWLFAAIMVLGNFIHLKNQPVIPVTKRLLGHVFEMPDSHWRKLSFAWAAYFLVLGGVHLFFAFAIPQYWLDFKLFGSMVISFLFLMSNFIALKGHFKQSLHR